MTPMRVDRASDQAAVSGLVAGWGLARPLPVVVLAGGAATMSAEAGDAAVRAIRDAILPAVVDAAAALVTGGTDAGVMRLAGEGRRAAGDAFPLIGVAPAALVSLPDDDPGAVSGGRAPTPVQPDHTHLLAVPGSRWGDETPWLFRVAEAVAGPGPVVTVVVNGGAGARGEVAESVRRGRPVIVVQGTGRTADEIALALAGEAPADGPDAAFRASGLVRAVRLDEDGALRSAILDALRPQPRGSGMAQNAPGAGAIGPQASYEDEMRALIERMDVTDEQRLFLRSRWLDQVGYMGDRATEAKKRYYRFRLATVVGGVIVPALVSISLMGPDKLGSYDYLVRAATFLVSLLVAITASVEGFYHFGDRWRHYRINAELLKAEGWQYLTHSGGYHKAPDPDQAFQVFASRVEDILRDDVEGFMSKVASTSPIERHDIFTKF